MFRCEYCKEEKKKEGHPQFQSEIWLDMNYHFHKRHPDVRNEMDKHMSRRIDGEWYPMTANKVKESVLVLDKEEDKKNLKKQ